MATVSGRLLFDRARTADSTGLSGIVNVPIILQNEDTNESLAVLTGEMGAYSFINVPDGNYRIVEAYGASPAVPSPGDFGNAVVTGVAEAVFPPIESVPNPPAGATHLDGVSQNTISITVEGEQSVSNQYILNGPVTYTPIDDLMNDCVNIISGNLVTDAFSGTMGEFNRGMLPNAGTPEAPFPQNVPDYTYIQAQGDGSPIPANGYYTVQNILNQNQYTNLNQWWRVADHTTGSETGKMVIVRGAEANSVFFTTEVNVKPDTDYLVSAWLLNLYKTTAYQSAGIRLQVLNNTGEQLYYGPFGPDIQPNPNNPLWRQVGAVINSGDDSAIIVNLINNIGGRLDSLAIDEVSIQEVELPEFELEMSISTNNAAVGDVVTYTASLTNTCQYALANLRFTDELPDGLMFELGSVRINGTPYPTYNPETGFNLMFLGEGQTATIEFGAIVGREPIPNPASNYAQMTFAFQPISGGSARTYAVTSNTVYLAVDDAEGNADLEIQKTASASRVQRGDTVIYTIVITNHGPDMAEGVELLEVVPEAILFPEYSLDGGANYNPWLGGHLRLGNMDRGAVRTVLMRGVVSQTAAGVYENDAEIMSHTQDLDLTNNNTLALIEIAICAADVDRMVEICLPVSVEPYANVREITSTCCGSAIVTPGNTCEGAPGGTCNFTMTQRICVAVPVEFGAVAQAGAASILCTGNDCRDCVPV